MEAAMGSRLLGTVEEASLEEILDGLRAALDPTLSSSRGNITATTHARNTHTISTTAVSDSNRGRPKLTYMGEMDQLATRHFRDTQAALLAVSGRSLPLIYHLVSNLVSPPHLMALLVLDIDGRFDPTCLTCDEEHLRHIYVQRPARSSPDVLRALVADAKSFMLYGGAAQPSVSRQWWGTVVLGGLGAGDVATGWNGWLRVDREQVQPFTHGMSAEEAVGERERRQEVVDAAGWAADSQWGGFVFEGS